MTIDQPMEGKLLCHTGNNPVSDMNGEKVMLSIANGSYYNMGQVGGRVWEILERPILFEDLLQTLQEEYDVDAQTCKEQTEHFLQQLMNEKLIRAVEPS